MRSAKLLCLVLLIGLGGISSASASYPYMFAVGQYYHSSPLNQYTYAAADRLESNLLYRIDRTLPILSTSFVSFDNLEDSSTFGRMLGDQVASRFSQHGYNVIELKLRSDQVVIREGTGELALSRNLAHIQDQYDAQAVLVGTYTFSHNLAFIGCKIVRTRDNTILASHDFTIRMDPIMQAIAGEAFARPRKPGKTVKDDGPLATGEVLLSISDPTGARLIQQRLAELGYYHSKIDGLWQTFSKKSLDEFKTKRKMGYAGQYDLETQKALFEGTGR